MKVAFFELLSPFVLFSHALEHDIGSLRFIEGDHLHCCPIFQLDQFGKEGLADLAFELAEIVGDGDAVELTFHLAVDPVLEAARVD